MAVASDAYVEIDLAVRPNTVTLPTVAIQTGQKGPYVFVAKPDQTVEMRNVELAGVEGNRTAIIHGLSAGERVVVQGQLRLGQGTRWKEAERVPGADKTGSLESKSSGVAAARTRP